ncbi:hypothetical protein ACOSP7_031735 [Xanthoceras sorbifolium]
MLREPKSSKKLSSLGRCGRASWAQGASELGAGGQRAERRGRASWARGHGGRRGWDAVLHEGEKWWLAV